MVTPSLACPWPCQLLFFEGLAKGTGEVLNYKSGVKNATPPKVHAALGFPGPLPVPTKGLQENIDFMGARTLPTLFMAVSPVPQQNLAFQRCLYKEMLNEWRGSVLLLPLGSA